MGSRGCETKPIPLDLQTRLHRELIGLLSQYSHCVDQRHLVLLSWMVAGLLLSQTVCFDRWNSVLPLGHCLAASWQRRCQRWLSNNRIDVEALYGPLVLWAIQHWQKPGQRQRCDVIALLERANRLLSEFGAITLLADRAIPSAELLGWFEGPPRWRYVMRLRSGTWIQGNSAPMGCTVRHLRLPLGHCRGFRDLQLWANGPSCC